MSASDTQDGPSSALPEEGPTQESMLEEIDDLTADVLEQAKDAVNSPAASITADADVLDPVPQELELTTGRTVTFEDMKTRQLFAMLRIVTRGGLELLPSLRIGSDMDSEQFTMQLLMVFVFAVPEAPNETVDFLRTMVKLKLPPAVEAAERKEQEKTFAKELDNPELDDLMSLVEAIIRREAPNLQALGQRLMGALAFANKANQIESQSESSTPEPS